MSDLIDMLKLRRAESDNNPSAVSDAGAVGFYQITKKGALADWNKDNPKQKYEVKDLYDPNINYKIADYYINKKVPRYLKNYGVPDTLENRLWMYNTGPGNFKAQQTTGKNAESITHLKRYLNATDLEKFTYNQ